MPQLGQFWYKLRKGVFSVQDKQCLQQNHMSKMSFHISQNEPLNSFCNAIAVVVSNNSISCCEHLQTDNDLAFFTETALKLNAAVPRTNLVYD